MRQHKQLPGIFYQVFPTVDNRMNRFRDADVEQITKLFSFVLFYLNATIY